MALLGDGDQSNSKALRSMSKEYFVEYVRKSGSFSRKGIDMVSTMLTAALRVASYLPLPYSALSIFMIIPAPIRDAVYDYVATRRYHWFGKSTECIIPTEDVLDRFVDKLEIQERMTQEQDDEEQVEEKS